MFDIILLFLFIYQIFYNNSLRYSAPFGLGSQPLGHLGGDPHRYRL